MATATTPDLAALRGHPSYVWRAGQERRFNLVQRYVPLTGKRILDIGCGLGMYVRRFRQCSDAVYGVDVEVDRVKQGAASLPNLAAAVGEHLPFQDGSLDVVFLHEVLEHVDDDAQVLREVSRVLRPGGHVVIYVPNRGYFFETHGFYLGKRFIFRLLPFVNWFPDPIRNIFAHHVRAYRYADLVRLFKPAGLREVVHGYVYPGFDNVVARHALAGRIVRAVCQAAESTPLRVFGLSHFLVLQKPAV